MASDEILIEIESELSKVRDDKTALLAEVRDKEAEEVRLAQLAEGVRAFLSRQGRAQGLPAAAHQPFTYLPNSTLGAVEYAVLALRRLQPGEGLDTNPLIAAMQIFGFTSSAQSVYLSVFGALNRAAKRPDGPIVKVNKKWALREWYPDGVPVQDDDDDDEKEKIVPPTLIATGSAPLDEEDLEDLLAD